VAREETGLSNSYFYIYFSGAATGEYFILHFHEWDHLRLYNNAGEYGVAHEMSTWEINLKEQTAISITL